MKHFALTPVLLLLAFAATAMGQANAVVTGPAQSAPGDLVVLDSSQSAGATQFAWHLLNSDKSYLPVEDNAKVVFSTAAPGRYTFALIAAGPVGKGNSAKLSTSIATHTVIIGKPKPVDPDVDPDVDPVPTPDVDPPIPADGFRVLIVEETGQRHKLTAAQQAVLFAPEVRRYLTENCVKGTDGKTPEWRILDQHADMQYAADHWRSAMDLERESLPWIHVSNGKTGYSGPLPGTVDATLELLKTYATQATVQQ